MISESKEFLINLDVADFSQKISPLACWISHWPSESGFVSVRHHSLLIYVSIFLDRKSMLVET